MSDQKPYYRTFLEETMQERCRRNSAYSLRAFARSLKIDASILSRIITGKRPLSLRTAKHLIERLALSGEQSQVFLESAIEEQRRSRLRREVGDRLGELKGDSPSDRQAEQVLRQTLKAVRLGSQSTIQPMTLATNLKVGPEQVGYLNSRIRNFCQELVQEFGEATISEAIGLTLCLYPKAAGSVYESAIVMPEANVGHFLLRESVKN